MTELENIKQRFPNLCNKNHLDDLQKKIEMKHSAAMTLKNITEMHGCTAENYATLIFENLCGSFKSLDCKEKEVEELNASYNKLVSESKLIKSESQALEKTLNEYKKLLDENARVLDAILAIENSSKTARSKFQKSSASSNIEWKSWQEREDNPIIYVEARFMDPKSDQETFQLPITKLEVLEDTSIAVKVIENIDWVWGEIEK